MCHIKIKVCTTLFASSKMKRQKALATPRLTMPRPALSTREKSQLKRTRQPTAEPQLYARLCRAERMIYMLPPTLPQINLENKNTEEAVFNLAKEYMLNLSKAQNQISRLNDLTIGEVLFILKNKQALFSCKYDFVPLAELSKMYKHQNAPLWDYICLAISIVFYTNSNIHIKTERKKRVSKPRNLEYRIKICYAEITVLRAKQTSWKDIVKYLRKHHRRLFQDYTLTVSYLRRVYIKINNERADTKKADKEDSPWTDFD